MAEKKYLTKKVKKYLDSRDLRYTFIEGKKMDVFQMHFPVKGGLSSVVEHVVIKSNRIQCRAIAPMRASRDKYNDVVEYLTRANCGMTVGAFEFDYRDGEIAFRDCLCAESDKVSKKDIIVVFATPVFMMQRYGNGLVKSLMGCGNPEEDIAFAENGGGREE